MKKVLTAALLITSSIALAQQDPQFSQNMFNRLYPNAGYAGTNDAICGSLLYRDQWDKFGGGPVSVAFGVDGPVKLLHGGLGLSVLSDNLGNEKNLNLKLAYSFHLDLGSGKLGIGIDGGLLQKGFGNDFRPVDQNDPNIPTDETETKFDLGAGVFYNSENFYLGASATHLTGGEFEFSKTKYEVVPNYYFNGGINFELSPSLKLTPSFFLKSDAKEMQLDINANLHIKDKFWIGASYRLEDAVVVMAGFTLFEKLRLGYAYDIGMSKLKDYHSGTHEVMVGYCYKIKPKALPVLRNVRFL